MYDVTNIYKVPLILVEQVRTGVKSHDARCDESYGSSTVELASHSCRSLSRAGSYYYTPFVHNVFQFSFVQFSALHFTSLGFTSLL